MIILNAKFEDNVTIILNPNHIVMIKDYGDGAVISTNMKSTICPKAYYHSKLQKVSRCES